MSDTDNGQDFIDSRDVIARIAEIEGEAQGRLMAENDEKDEPTYWSDLADIGAAMERLMDVEDFQEWNRLTELQEECEAYSEDWAHGATLIRDTYFTAYAKELASDVGAIEDDARWPANHIDWDAAAADLQNDYTEIDYAGIAYWIR